MGYSLVIGERGSGRGWNARPELINHPDAPAFGEPTDHENQRWPSYSGWEDFVQAVSEYTPEFALRFGQWERGNTRPNTVLRKHPGVYRLWSKDVVLVEKALKSYLLFKHGMTLSDLKMGEYPLPKWGDGFMSEDQNNGDQNLARLVWLHYWVKWAVENCTTPVFYNS